MVSRRRFLPSASLVILVAASALGPGCARTDWIQETLVTADVTGVWRDSGGTIDLRLRQEGSRVTGSMTWRGSFVNASGTILGAVEGTVAGDVFRFRQTGGVDIGVNGDMTVSGDEMRGLVRWSADRRDMILQRTGP